MSSETRSFLRARFLVPAAFLLAIAVTSTTASSAAPIPPQVDLGSANSFAVLAGSTVKNIGQSVVSGDLGVSPGSAITGFSPPPTEPGLVINGSTHAADPVADLAQSDETAAYVDAAGRSQATNIPVELGGTTLAGGLYASPTLGLTGTLTLDGDANSVWIFQVGTTLTTSTASQVVLTGGASACNVFWQIGSSATLGTGSTFVGTVLAQTAITANTGANVEGRLLAQSAAVTLDTNIVTSPTCTVPDPISSSSVPSPTASGSSSTPSPTASGSSSTSSSPTSSGIPSSSTTGSSGSTPTTSTGPGTVAGTGSSTASVPSGSTSSTIHASTTTTASTTSTALAGHHTSTTSSVHATATHSGSSATSTTLTGLTDTTTSLARTGSDIETSVVLGLLALLGGGAILFIARRRTVTGRRHR